MNKEIYHSKKTAKYFLACTLIMLVIGLVLKACRIYGILEQNGTSWTSISIWFLLAVVAYINLKEKRKPYLSISQTGVTINLHGKLTEIRFKDVECFFLTKVNAGNFIGVKLNKNAEFAQYQNAKIMEKAAQKLLKNELGISMAFMVDDLDTDPQSICDLLNDRLKFAY